MTNREKLAEMIAAHANNESIAHEIAALMLEIGREEYPCIEWQSGKAFDLDMQVGIAAKKGDRVHGIRAVVEAAGDIPGAMAAWVAEQEAVSA